MADLVTKDSQDSKSEKKSEGARFKWGPHHDRYLCKYLAEQTQNGMKVDKTFKMTCLKHLASAMNSEFKIDINISNVRHHLRTLKDRWDEVLKILKHSSGCDVDYKMGYIKMDLSTADEYIKAHPKACNFINKTIDNFDEMSIIFSDDKATGKYSVTSNKPNALAHVEDASQHAQVNKIQVCDLETLGDIPLNDSENVECLLKEDDLSTKVTASSHTATTSSTKAKTLKRSRTSGHDDIESWSECARMISSAIEKVGETMSQQLVASQEVTTKKLVIKEMLKLGNNLGISKRELVVKCYKLLESKEKVEFFVALDDDELRKDWLEAVLVDGDE